MKKKPATVFDSIKSAAAGLGVPESLLKRLKSEGAPGFRGSRVYASDLLPFLKTAAAEGDKKYELECRRLRVQCERLEFASETDRKKYWLRAECESWLTGKIERSKAVLKRRLVVELPPHLVGLRAPEIAEKMEGVVAQTIAALRSVSGTDEE